MEKEDRLIVGGSATGITVGISARRYDPDARMVLIRKERKVADTLGTFQVGTHPMRTASPVTGSSKPPRLA